MKQGFFEILENTPLTREVYRLRLRGDVSALTTPGQFVNIRLEGLYLRRPLSVCDLDDGVLTLVYKVVGKGTALLSGMREGRLDLLTGLGNGFDLSAAGERPLLLGGGVGVPPLYLAAKELCAAGKKVTVLLGFNRTDECILEEEFRALAGARVFLLTADGSRGEKGFVTDAAVLREGGGGAFTHYFACGPEPMLRAVHRTLPIDGQLSFEQRMGCGFGACMGCSCRTLTGSKRICREGPVLRKGEILWN